MRKIFRRLSERMFDPVPADRLAWFRILFGILMAYEAVHLIAGGWIKLYYVDPILHFKYYGFGWVPGLPGNWPYVLVAALGALGVAIAVGWRYRLSMALFAAGFFWLFLIDKSYYLNHWYLIGLLAVLMALVKTPFFGATVPAWNLWLLRGQVVLVYFYAGIAKLEPDWVQGWAMAEQLAARTDAALPAFLHGMPWAPAFLSWGGIAFDLGVGPALLWSRTRAYALAAAAGFHLINSFLFTIGVFPWLMLAITFTLFLPDRRAKPGATQHVPAPRRRKALYAFLAAWTIVQVGLPLRHLFYPGNANWTEEGHYFAWRMMLRSKQGQAHLYATDPRTGATHAIDLRKMLTIIQYKELAVSPDLLLQLAHHVAETIEAETGVRPVVRAYAEATLNRRPIQLLVDPKVDLAAQPRDLRPAAWIVPLAERPSGQTPDF